VYLRGLVKVNCAEHGKSDKPHINGISTVREREGLADIGSWKKRKPLCNRVDRGFYNEFIGADTKSEKMQTSGRSEREKDFLKIHNHCIVVGASNMHDNQKRKR